MHRWLLWISLLAACGSRQAAQQFTTPLPREQAICRAERMMRTGPWHLDVDLEQGRIRAKPAGMTLAALLGSQGDRKGGLPAAWDARTDGGSYATPRAQRVERNIVVAIADTSDSDSLVRVFVEDVACISDGSSLQGACSVSYPGNDKVNATIDTLGRSLALWLQDVGNECVKPVTRKGFAPEFFARPGDLR